MSSVIQVRAPKFELYQMATVYWNEEEHITSIVRRWFDMDDGTEGLWWYELEGLKQLFPESVIKPSGWHKRNLRV